MVLIMSMRGDYSTIQVCHWLKYYNINFIRIDKEDEYKIRKVLLGNLMHFIIYKEPDIEISMSEIKAVWYRRGHLNITYPLQFNNTVLKNSIIEHLRDESLILEHYFYFLMDQIPHIGSYNTRSMNKLEVLYKAFRLGITIPETQICDNRDGISISSSPLVTKSISETFMPKTLHGNYITYTENVINKDIPAFFFPSLFQNKIEKEADIRIFYINGCFYSMAIMSQVSQQTSTDFRKYLKEKPNRSFPFRLPVVLEAKLHLLMKQLDLETGSIDMIFTKDEKFIFLEVNPVGQFGMISFPCNYNIEKVIANQLKEIMNNER